MGKFASAEKQAASVVKALSQSRAIVSLGTARNYESALTRVAEFAKTERLSLRDLTPEKIQQYLEIRSELVGQKTLDMERQAAQCMMQHLTGKLAENERLTVVKSEHEQILSCRSYTAEQVSLIAGCQRDKAALSTEIAHAAGLRAHELLTLRRGEERGPSDRPARDEKFQGRAGEIYTVKGKGGLVREVMLPTALAERLEARRLDEPVRVTDRGIHYGQHYDISGGQRWSSSFTQAANRALGWSEGAHGVRHSYAQERMHELQSGGMTRDDALETVSQEMGHFRPEITEVYLR
ncbi:site-specific integrase (plasmid) [Shewanella sp. JNE10-2]|jgi:integrase|nr:MULTISPECIES: site-specific integrase [unclassified Shewanella]MCK7632262.1 site-specific integrase [Shewanella sp. JNE9-1]MCK7647419.1 site-specific integrase [Shewanella sp. JNE3-1]MCK7655566.1 site-specific integrase [Shewanella sp. JNE4-1]UPO29457.1 site-specific integrase [Shewanella sp. JNE10-2]UPO37620.1 site-specific integrase [Shewanella sp. JNE7]